MLFIILTIDFSSLSSFSSSALLYATVCAERVGDTVYSTVSTDEFVDFVGDGDRLGRVVAGTGDVDRCAVLKNRIGLSTGVLACFAVFVTSALAVFDFVRTCGLVDDLKVKPYLDTSFFGLPCTGRFQYVWSPNSLSGFDCSLIC